MKKKILEEINLMAEQKGMSLKEKDKEKLAEILEKKMKEEINEKLEEANHYIETRELMGGLEAKAKELLRIEKMKVIYIIDNKDKQERLIARGQERIEKMNETKKMEDQKERLQKMIRIMEEDIQFIHEL